MADAVTILDQISTNQLNPAVTANDIDDAESTAALYGRRASACAGLTWGYYGGTATVGGVPRKIANGTLTLTASSTCYIRVQDSTGVVSFTTSFNSSWPSPSSGYTALYEVTTNATGTNSDWIDWRVNGSSGGGSGSQGAQGAQGATGSGSQGAQGAQGAQGSTGSTGAQGPQGTQGTQGTQGSQGTQGTQGNQGASGAASVTGTGFVFATSGAVDAAAKTASAATALLSNFVGDSGSGGTKGLVPAPSSGDTAAGKFLSASGAFTVPSGISTAPSAWDWIFGDGTDGAATLDGSNTVSWATKDSSTQYTMTRPCTCTNLTISAGVTLLAANFPVFVSGTLTVTGSLNNRGNSASGITAGNTITTTFYAGAPAGGATSGGSGSASNTAMGGAGGAGGAATGGPGVGGGTAGGTVTSPLANSGGLAYATTLLGGVRGRDAVTTQLNGGAGGSGGAAAGGGAGGAGGGCLGVWAKYIAGVGSITVKGGDGGNAVSGNSGGGGGGGGGCLWVGTTTTGWDAIVTADVSGGNGGTPSGTGKTGAAGSTGRKLSFVLA